MNKRTNGNPNILNEEQEQQRLQIVDLELKARYWEAQWKIRFYTLEAEKLQPEYDVFIKEQKQKQEEAIARFMAEMEKQKDEGKIKVEERVLESNKEFLDTLNPA